MSADIKKLIDGNIGENSTMLTKSARLKFCSKELEAFLSELNGRERNKFELILNNFCVYYKVINHIRNKNNKAPAWTNLIFITLFGLMEVSQENPGGYVVFFNFVKKKLKKSQEITNEVVEEWRIKYGAAEKIREFMKDYFVDEEKNEILEYIKGDPKWSKVKDFKEFIREVIQMRNDFIHKLSLGHFSESNMTPLLGGIDKNGVNV